MMIRLALSSLVTLWICSPAFGQYYYKDLLSVRETRSRQQALQKNHIHKVDIHSYDPDQTENKDFVCEETLSPDYRQGTTVTSSAATGSSTLASEFDADSRVIRSEDSSADAVTTTWYTYDPDGRVTLIRSTSGSMIPDSSNYFVGELHLWTYGPGGEPSRMLRVKDKTDTTLVRFIVNSEGEVTDEVSSRYNVESEHYYYYYDDQHRLTDVVRFNDHVQQMLPDYIFQYDDEGRLAEMMVVQANNSDYQIWRYEYDSTTGLRSRELCYDKDKHLIGSIGYTYE